MPYAHIRKSYRGYKQGSQRSMATIVFRGPTLPSHPGLRFCGLVRPGQVSAAVGPYTGTYRGLAAIWSRHLVVAQVFMANMGLKISC
jgi:hypothetical protein